VRDATGLVVGSAAWLDHQRKIERGQTPEKLQKQAVWQIVLGVVIIVIGAFIGIKAITGANALGFELTPVGYVVVYVLPYVVGGSAIIHGIRQRSGRAPAPTSATNPSSWPTPPTAGATPPPSPYAPPATAPYAPPVTPPAPEDPGTPGGSR
jgi:hypothetical protein